MRSRCLLLLVVAAVVGTLCMAPSAADAQTITPGLISTDAGNVTLTLTGVSAADYVFLYNAATCNTAPALRAATAATRTAHERVKDNAGSLEVRFDVSKLENNTFYLCHSATGDFPTSYAQLTTMEVIHTIYVSPSVLNIDQKNVSVLLRHSTAYRSIYLLLAVAGGVPTGLGCRDIESGVDMSNRTHITTVRGDLRANLDISHLAAGEYHVCYSEAEFVNVATTAFLLLPQRIHLTKTKLCIGGGVTGICSVSPLYTDKRVGTQQFVLYNARPRTYTYLLRKDSCGASTYTCADDHATVMGLGYASPVARITFNRSVDIDLSGVHSGASFVFCHKNSSLDTPPSFLPYSEVTAATVSVSDGIDPSQTIVSCCGAGNTFVAGTGTWCTVYTYDKGGLPSGVAGDECNLLAHVEAPNGNLMCSSRLMMRDVGRFEFSFVSTVTGLNVASAQHFNMTTANKDEFANIGSVVNITAAAFDETNSVSSCAKVGAVDVCQVTNRDQYNNTIDTCESRSDDTMECNGAGF